MNGVARTFATLVFFGMLVGAVACGTRITIGEVTPDPGDVPFGDGGSGTDGGSRDAAGDDSASSSYEPCAGKACGDTCTLCRPGDSTCVETAVVKSCDATGKCSAGGGPICSSPDGGYDPCKAKTCGESCRLCDPANVGCVETAVVKQCNKAGACSPSAPGC